MAFDGSYNSVALLLHGDGADNSTTFTDHSPTPKTITPYGDAKISTAQSQWGGASMYFDGTGDYLKMPDHANFSLGAADWTLEGWFWQSTAATFRTLFSHAAVDDSANYSLQVLSYLGKLRVGLGSGTSFVAVQCPDAHTLNAWHYFIVKCVAGVVSIGLDGTFRVSGTLPGALNNSTSALTLGASLNAAGNVDTDYGYWLGYLDDIRLTPGVARPGYAVPTEAFANAAPPTTNAWVAAPLPGASALMWTNFAAVLGSPVTRYAMDLVTPGGVVRVPISSWQATLRTGGSNYVQCVVPACTDWASTLLLATEFVIYRQAVLPGGGVIDYEMARSPLEQIAFDRGPARHTCTLSGYSAGFAESVDPPAVYDRTLSGVRSVSSGTAGWRVRCAVDWLLRPGHRAYVEAEPFVVAYINYYSPTGFDSYMDVGGAT